MFKIGQTVKLISKTLDVNSEFHYGQEFKIVAVNNPSDNTVISINLVTSNPKLWEIISENFVDYNDLPESMEYGNNELNS